MSTRDVAPLPPEGDVGAAQLTKELERLANELFSGPRYGGGASPAVFAPPVHEIPLGAATDGTVPPLLAENAAVPPTSLVSDPIANPDRATSVASSPSAGFAPPSTFGQGPFHEFPFSAPIPLGAEPQVPDSTSGGVAPPTFGAHDSAPHGGVAPSTFGGHDSASRGGGGHDSAPRGARGASNSFSRDSVPDSASRELVSRDSRVDDEHGQSPYFLGLAGPPNREPAETRAPLDEPLAAPSDGAAHRSMGGATQPATKPSRHADEDSGRKPEGGSWEPSSLELHELKPELVPAPSASRGIFDPHAVRRDFPILDQRVNGRPLVWLDNAATTQKPNAVIDRLSLYYRRENSNVHRAAHTLAARATDAYEGARHQVRRFLNASSSEEIIFVRGATEGINLVAQSWGRRYIEPGDEIVITWLEHHANIVPWQMLCSEKGAKLRVVPVDDTGQVILEEYERLLSSRTRIVSLPQVSNALGTIVPAREMVAMAHRRGAYVLVDGAQAVSHMPVDVQLLDCDFYVFSGHKIFAPTGIGVVYGKKDILNAMPPWQGGGNMIADVTFAKTTYQPPPGRFEAGTGSIADAVGLGAALEYLSGLGLPNVERYEHELRVYAEGCLAQVPGLRLIGTAKEKAGVISFILDGHRTEDVGGMLDLEGIAVRSGHHCAQPILRRFGLESTVRASLAPYNTREDIDALVSAVRRLQVGRPRT